SPIGGGSVEAARGAQALLIISSPEAAVTGSALPLSNASAIPPELGNQHSFAGESANHDCGKQAQGPRTRKRERAKTRKERVSEGAKRRLKGERKVPSLCSPLGWPAQSLQDREQGGDYR